MTHFERVTLVDAPATILESVASRMRKTGTTVVGVICESCVVLASDTRATAGDFIADPYCVKLHKVHDTLYAAGAGTAADCDHVIAEETAQCEIYSKIYNRRLSFEEFSFKLAHRMFKGIFYLNANYILGSYEEGKPKLLKIGSGSTLIKSDEFLAFGSGEMLAAQVLHTHWRAGLTEQEGRELAIKAINAGIESDAYSGTQVDLVVIDSAGSRFHRAADTSVTNNYYSTAPLPLSDHIKINMTPIAHDNIFKVV